MLEHVVQTKKKHLAEDNPSRLNSEHTLAFAYGTDGQIEQAIQLLEHVVEVEQNLKAKDRIISLQALVDAYWGGEQNDKAKKLQEQLTALKESIKPT